MSVQKPQPLIWLARSFTSSCVAAGRPESAIGLFAAFRYLMNLPATAFPKRLSRASTGLLLRPFHWLRTLDGWAREVVTPAKVTCVSPQVGLRADLERLPRLVQLQHHELVASPPPQRRGG